MDASKLRLVKAFSMGKKPGFSIIIPISSGKFPPMPIFLPETSTLPFVANINPEISLNKTLLPHQFLPTIP